MLTCKTKNEAGIMGAPVSKPDNFPATEKVSETVFESATDEHTSQQTEKHAKFGSTHTVSNSRTAESDVVQMLRAAEEEDIDDKEWGDIYKRLKTNKNGDLHISNTRFKRNSFGAFKGDIEKKSGPVVTSSATDRPMRNTSANFSPHTVADEHDKSEVETSHRENAEMIGNEYSDENDRDNSGERNVFEQSPLYSDKQPDQQSANPISLRSSRDSEKLSISNYNSDDSGQVKSENLKQICSDDSKQYLYYGQSCLNIPSNNRGLQSPTPKTQDSDSLSGDDDEDPLEGLNIPRERAYSFGSTSIYSVKEVSDDLYQQYKAEIRNCVRSYGFFEAFPSPSVLSEAQKIYRRLDTPTPVDDDGNILPHPPKVTKNEYLTDELNSFDEVLEKIENMPESLSLDGKIVDVVDYLCSGLDNDKNKLIMLAAWIALQQKRSERHKRSNPDTTDNWAGQFRTMCKFARIKTKLVKGFIRGTNYVPGSNLSLNRGHWLAILVNNTWLLMNPDVHVSLSVDLKTKNSNQKNSLFDIVETIFKDPEDFIFSHYPDEEHWQLLARHVTDTELYELAVLKSGFFAFRMTLLNCHRSVMVIKTSETLISLAFPENQMLQFQCKLYNCDASMQPTHLRTYAFLETNLKDKVVNVRVRFPEKGSYILEIFGSVDDHCWQPVISYKLVYEGNVFSSPYPANPREEWGPGLEAAQMGVTAVLYHSGEIIMRKGVIQIAFRNEKVLHYDHVLTKEDCNLNSDSMKVSTLKDKKNDVIFVIDIDAKVTGIFTLQLLAKTSKKTEFKNFCNYMIRKEKIVSIPKLTFCDTSMSTEDREPILAPENGKFSLTVDATGFIQLSVELRFQDRQELNFSDHARHWIDETTGYIELSFPRKGKYSLQVFGQTASKGYSRTLREETIHVDIPSEKWSCFPKAGTNWNSWYRIEAPLSHHLEEKDDVTFQVHVKNALDVAVLGANGWFHLDRVGDSWQWIGQVLTGPKSTRCRLVARFETGSDKWSDLLWFKIMSEEDYEVLENQQINAREKAVAENRSESNKSSK